MAATAYAGALVAAVRFHGDLRVCGDDARSALSYDDGRLRQRCCVVGESGNCGALVCAAFDDELQAALSRRRCRSALAVISQRALLIITLFDELRARKALQGNAMDRYSCAATTTKKIDARVPPYAKALLSFSRTGSANADHARRQNQIDPLVGIV